MNYKDKPLLEFIEETGREILDGIPRDQKDSPRRFYSVSQILLKVLETRDKHGKTDESEIHEIISSEASIKSLNSNELTRAMRTAKQLEKQLKSEEWSGLDNADALIELLKVLGTILGILLTAVKLYQSGHQNKRRRRKSVKK